MNPGFAGPIAVRLPSDYDKRMFVQMFADANGGMAAQYSEAEWSQIVLGMKFAYTRGATGGAQIAGVLGVCLGGVVGWMLWKK